MKKSIVFAALFTVSVQVSATWTPFSDVSYVQTNTAGEFLFWLSGHTNNSANPGRCDYPVFKVKKADGSYAELTGMIKDAFNYNKKVRINITSACHDTYRYKRINNVQLKR